MISTENPQEATKFLDLVGTKGNLDRSRYDLLPFEGFVRIFLDFSPAQLVLTCRCDAMNEHLISSIVDLSSLGFCRPSEIMSLFNKHRTYQVQLEADDSSLIVHSMSCRLELFFVEGQILFLQLGWAETCTALIEWVAERKAEEYQLKLPYRLESR